MARLAVAEGIRTVVATPHQLGNYGRNRGETIRCQTAALRQLLAEQSVPLEVLPGADVRIEPDLVSKIRQGDVLTLADQRRYVLLELPHEIYLPLDRLLGELQSAGMIGILSHPERNQGILAQPRVLASLRDRGCLLQITAGSLVGTFGPQSQAMAERMVVQGLVHFVATDAHGAKARRPLMRRAFQRVAQLAGAEKANQLCSTNPACIITNAKLSVASRKPAAGGFFRWRRAS